MSNITAVQTGSGWDVDGPTEELVRVDTVTKQLTSASAQEAVRGVSLLPAREYLTKGLLCGRMMQQANAADFTSHIEFTFEAEPGTIQIGVLNNIATALTGVKVGVAFSDASAVQNGTLLGALNSGSWTNIPFGGSTSGATIAAATATNTVDNPVVTWSDVVSVAPKARADGSGLVIGHVRVEVPTANATIPLGFWADITELEADGSTTVAPFGRFIRGRSQAVLGVTTKTAFTSTTSTGRVVPVLIRYTPRNGAAKGYTVAVFGNSLDEGVTSGGTARRVGWTGRVQRDLSSTTRPVEIVNLAVHGAAASRTFNRVSTLIGQVQPELYALPVSNINSATYPGASAAQALTDMTGIRGNTNLARHSAAGSGAVPVFLTSPPANFAARPVVEYDKLRLALNAEFTARASLRDLVADFSGVISGPVDANGQVTIPAAYTSDNLHESDAGAELWCAEFVRVAKPLVA